MAALWLGCAQAGAVQSPLSQRLGGGRRGGVLTSLQETGFEHIDPGQAYYSLDYEVVYATQRPLYSFRPDSVQAVPDLASGPPVISADKRTVTVQLRRGVRFSPPVNREVTSADVAYAIERGANPHVANPYIHAYFDAIEGMPHAEGGPIPGITTPNAHEIVFQLTEPLGAVVAAALAMPLSAPVPRGYAARFDRDRPSSYERHEVATGPYMIRDFHPLRSVKLVRNPNWRRSTDIRPAYLDGVDVRIGGINSRIGRAVLRGRRVVENEPPTQRSVREALETAPAQLEISPGAGDHYIGVNNAHGPFRDIDLRKALWAALDRKAMDAARGGPLVSGVASHFLYPTIPGFEQAGGTAGPTGPQFDFDEYPEGNLEVARRYMRLAGYPSGGYTGGEVVEIVAARGNPAELDAEIVWEALKELGFKTKLVLVETPLAYARYCDVPEKEVDVCPSVGWIADFPDPQAVLDITFNGRFINPTGNVNWSQTNVPAINAQMSAAETLFGASPRGAAWAKIDDELVEDAAAIPFDWDSQANIEGRGVAGVGDLWDVGEWDYSWTSLR